MAIQPIGSSTSLVPSGYYQVPAVSRSGSTLPDESTAAANAPASSSATSAASAADAYTVVSETTSTNADGSVTTVTTYKDGHTSTMTSPATVANPSARLLAGDFNSTNNSVGRLLNILV